MGLPTAWSSPRVLVSVLPTGAWVDRMYEAADLKLGPATVASDEEIEAPHTS